MNLLIDHPELTPARPTDDVDVIIEIVPGTLVLFKAGWKGICTVHETLRNVYMLS